MLKLTQNIKITERAQAKIKSLVEAKKDVDQKFRVFIKSGGCSGFQYDFKLDPIVHPARDNFVDIIGEKIMGLEHKIIIDDLSLSYLDGASINYIENLQGARFIIENPNAATTCGCGTSFSMKGDPACQKNN